MADRQMPLPLTTAACGYCHDPLTLQPGGHWQCTRCAPALAEVETDWDWRQHHRRARRTRRTRRSA